MNDKPASLASNPRDYLAELERASSPIRELMVDAGRYINYLRSVVRDMLPHFPKDHPHYPGFSEAAAGGPQPSQARLRFTWVWDDFRRNYRLTTVDMGDGLVAGYDHEAGWYERQLIEEIERLRGERRPSETSGDWRPIETAPRDGQYILVKMPEWRSGPPARVTRWKDCASPGWDSIYSPAPVAWAPLPGSPQKASPEPAQSYQRKCIRCGKMGPSATPEGVGIYYCSTECAD